MLCVSVHQPWAHAILHLGKTVENRTWATRHRGPLLIHASKNTATLDRITPTAWMKAFGIPLPARSAMAFGAIVGVVDLLDCRRVREGEDGSPVLENGHASKWAEVGFYGWQLDNPRAFAEPIQFRGAQMLFEVPDELLPAEFRGM